MYSVVHVLAFQTQRIKLTAKEVDDPYRGERVTRLLRDGRIMLPPREVNNCIDYFTQKTQNDGPGKLTEKLRCHYYGISKNQIRERVYKSQAYAAAKPRFVNKAPLRPIRSSAPFERHQIDLVCLSNIAEYAPQSLTKDGHIYVLSILAVYTRFLWLRLIREKSSQVVADELEKLYLEFGTPKIIQSDCGTEFKGYVEELCKRFQIKMIHSSPRHPQSQGKIERSHGTWKTKVHDIVNNPSQTDKDWTKRLPYIVKQYNDGHHRMLKTTPYEMLFGIKSNLHLQEYKDGFCEDAVLESDNWITDDDDAGGKGSASQCKANVSSECSHRLHDQKIAFANIRRLADVNDATSSTTMVEQHKAKHPPSQYHVGEMVLMKPDRKDKGVRRGGLSLRKPKALQAIVVNKRDNYTYTVALLSDDRWNHRMKVGVESLTSLTRKLEHKRREEVNTFGSGKTKTVLDTIASFSVAQDSGMDGLLVNAANQGMTLDSDNPAGGDCMFYALQQQLENLGIHRTHRQIRREIVEYLSNNPIIGTAEDAVFVPPFTGLPAENFEEYLSGMADHEWGDHVVLLGAANLYNVGIWVLGSTPSCTEPNVIEPAGGIVGPLNSQNGNVYLGHITELHYVTLTPIPNANGPNTEPSSNENDNVSASVHNSNQASYDIDMTSFPSNAGDLGPVLESETNYGLCACTSSSNFGLCACTGSSNFDEFGQFDWGQENVCDACGRNKKTIEILSDAILVYIFALATAFCDDTTKA